MYTKNAAKNASKLMNTLSVISENCIPVELDVHPDLTLLYESLMVAMSSLSFVTKIVTFSSTFSRERTSSIFKVDSSTSTTDLSITSPNLIMEFFTRIPVVNTAIQPTNTTSDNVIITFFILLSCLTVNGFGLIIIDHALGIIDLLRCICLSCLLVYAITVPRTINNPKREQKNVNNAIMIPGSACPSNMPI